VKQSYEIAKRLFERAAEQGDAGAITNLGLLYETGQGVEQSYERAVEYYDQAAQLGHDTKAQYNLGRMYANGFGVQQDLTKAKELFSKAVAGGNKLAVRGFQWVDDEERRLAALDSNAIVCSLCGLPETETRNFSKTKCPCKSTQYCNTTCQKKHWKEHRNECKRLIAEIKRQKKMKKEAMATTQVQKEVGERKEEEDKTTTPKKKKEEEEEGDECPICLEELPKDPTTFTRFTCCGNGIHTHCFKDMESMKMAGTCPFCRAPRPSSHEEVVAQTRPHVKKKKAWALVVMGQAYRLGEGVKQSYEMTTRLFEQAAQQGYATAMSNLAFMYCHGEGVEQSYEKAFEYYEQAADLGLAEAQYNLGVLYYNGQGVEKDTSKGREWITKAAAQGDETATQALKVIHGR
jgi:TPR repeat protein